MTYIITPYKKAFKINENAVYSVRLINEHYLVTHDGIPISPEFVIDDYEYDEVSMCEFHAIEWLEDFLIRLSENPHVIHCTIDGEIFTN